ncbi:CGNR zinc finger domain-containing protein [Microbacterium sp. No. 7]|uniref:CGNR zinc finger domain-containing protein n=1 Tax=Microbacterium sp. No. 7 TaxID=1714373 RepID=UPI0006CFECC3|nr:CGNR zinc finger domain-containing protein [Microbacterium sp. No. 7]ALJ18933.1 hypothetical protein AOA12_03020 [Microbacterium sp. No. 7]
MELPRVTPSRLGGDVAMDFFNTVGWRLDPARRHEGLPTYPHLLSWTQQVGLLSEAETRSLARQADERPEAAAAEHARAIELRDDTYDALTDDREPAALQQQLPSAHAHSQLRRTPGGAWTWAPAPLDLATPRHRLALELARLLTSDAILRFHRCEDRHCGWVFLDTSRLHNRRWCSSADCGNRNRVRAHYARTKTGARGETE